jgi:hypothetical protein
VPAITLAQLIRQLPPGSATGRAEMGDMADWSLIATNLADLVDLMSYWLRSEYTKWTTDPDDPEVKKMLERRKKAGQRPPPVPLVEPVAARPPSLAKLYQQQYAELLEYYGEKLTPAAALAKDGEGLDLGHGKRLVTSDVFDAMLGI